MSTGAPIGLTECRRFFAKPATPSQRQYEALRAYFVERLPSAEVARSFGYTPAAFRMLCYDFRHGQLPDFFAVRRPGRREQPKEGKVRDQVVALRKRNYSIYDISRALKEQGTPLGATAVRGILIEEGFAALPRRLDEERPVSVGPTKEAVADPAFSPFWPRMLTAKSSATQMLTFARVRRPRRSSVSSSSGHASTAAHRNISSSTPSSPPISSSIDLISRGSFSSPCADARQTCSPKSTTCRHQPGVRSTLMCPIANTVRHRSTSRRSAC